MQICKSYITLSWESEASIVLKIWVKQTLPKFIRRALSFKFRVQNQNQSIYNGQLELRKMP